jgi:hypothetical protein
MGRLGPPSQLERPIAFGEVIASGPIRSHRPREPMVLSAITVGVVVVDLLEGAFFGPANGAEPVIGFLFKGFHLDVIVVLVAADGADLEHFFHLRSDSVTSNRQVIGKGLGQPDKANNLLTMSWSIGDKLLLWQQHIELSLFCADHRLSNFYLCRKLRFLSLEIIFSSPPLEWRGRGARGLG